MSAANLRILVVDDNEDFAQSLGPVLRHYLPGLQTKIALTARAGLARIREVEHDPIDLVLLDMVLPCGKTEDLLEELLQSKPAIPVIIITGHAGNQDLEARLIRMGAQAVVSKTLPPDDLARMIAQTVERHKIRVHTLTAIHAASGSLGRARETVGEMKALNESIGAEGEGA